MDAKQIADAARMNLEPDEAEPLTDDIVLHDLARVVNASGRMIVDPRITRYIRGLREAKRDADRARREALGALRGLAIRKGSGVLSCALCNSVWRPHEGEKHDADCNAKP